MKAGKRRESKNETREGDREKWQNLGGKKSKEKGNFEQRKQSGKENITGGTENEKWIKQMIRKISEILKGSGNITAHAK